MVVLSDAAATDAGVRAVAALNRSRPFHWEADTGINVRAVILEELCAEHVSVVLAAESALAGGQVATRQRLFEDHLLPEALLLGVGSLIVERRSNAENDADRRVIRDWSRSRRVWRPEVEHVTKGDPRGWLADAASGAWSDALLGRDRQLVLPRLIAARTVRALSWRP